MPTGGIKAWVEQQLGSAVRSCHPVGGGCIHNAWGLELADGRRLFAKTNRAAALALLAAEVEGLRALARWAPPTLQLPEPLALGCAGGQAVLLLSWLELAGMGAGAAGTTAAAESGWASLGASLAQLHRASAAAAASGRCGDLHAGGFGFPVDNFIGSGPQANGWMPAWATFFVQRRLRPQLALAARQGDPFRGAEVLLQRVEQLLGAHPCAPVLVHGDLWSGNAALVASDGAGQGHGIPATGAMLDPATYWGDREVDLAMARLFGGFPPAFFAGYEAEWPLPPDWDGRVELYNLYHLLNHANLFGGGYRGQAQAVINTLLEV
jgi:fructosamine-3-kinase